MKFYDYDTPMSTFNLAHYPASESEGLGISDHTDWELFTLLYPLIQFKKIHEKKRKIV